MIIAAASRSYDVPPGEYTARLVEVKELPPNPEHPEWGQSFAWEFEVTEGEYAGKRPSCLTPVKATTRNGLGRLLAGMLGRRPGAGESINLNQFVGNLYRVRCGLNATMTRTRVHEARPVSG